MRLYEFEAKKLLAEAGVPVSEGHLAASPEEAFAAAHALGGGAVLKAQVLIGGRGKAGGIRFAADAEEARREAGALLGSQIRGYPVDRVLVEPRLSPRREFYLGVTLDRANYRIAVLASSRGGVEIEESAREDPASVHRLSLGVREELFLYQGIELARAIGLRGPGLREVGRIIQALHRVFVSRDAKLVEVNPLMETGDGCFVAADARISLDDDALFRQRDLAAMGIGPRHEEGELTERERAAGAEGIPYVDLDGDIGMFPGGAGFGIMGNDFITYFGGRPANFMDSGGGPTPERLARMLRLLDDNPNVRAIFGARFGGISRCDDFARGVVKFLDEHGLSKPMVLRMTGNMWQEGVRIFEEARAKNPALFERIEIHGIETPIEEVAQRAVALAHAAGSGAGSKAVPGGAAGPAAGGR